MTIINSNLKAFAVEAKSNGNGLFSKANGMDIVNTQIQVATLEFDLARRQLALIAEEACAAKASIKAMFAARNAKRA